MSSITPDHSLNGESKSELMIALTATLTILCTMVVSARIYTRAVMLRTFGTDDAFITITQGMALGLNAATILETHYGVGRHSWLTTPENGVRQLQCLFAAIQLYIWSLCFVKLSLLIQYRRIFPARWLQRLSIIIMTFASVWNVAQSILVTFACVPFSLIHPFMADQCLDSLTIWYIAAGINIVTDFVVWLLPIPLLSSLQLPTRQKALLCMVFGLGLFTCGISIVRATTLYLVVEKNDPSWYGTDAAIWSMVEVNCAILCSCLPTIRFLVAKLIPWLGLRSQTSQYLNYIGVKLSSKSRKSRPRSGFVPRSRRGHVADEIPLHGLNKTGGSSSDDHTRPDLQENPVPDVDSRWAGVTQEERGMYYQSNKVSAWVSADPDDASPTKSKRQSEDEYSDSQTVQRRGSDMDLGRQILITTTTIVQEDRQNESPAASKPRRHF